MKGNCFRQLTCMSLGLSLLFCACAYTPAKITLGEPKNTAFISANDLLHQAVSEKADSLAPRVYTKAVQHYLEAENYFEREEDPAKIKKKLETAGKWAEESIEVSRTVQSNFPELVGNRERAIIAGADEMELESYRQAEKLLGDTASLVENNDLIKAQNKAQKSGKKFLKAELEAIQKKIAGTLNEKIREAKNAQVLAPETYEMAVNYRDKALKTLEQNRCDQNTARQLVAKGEEYINKALFFTKKIKELKSCKENWEKLFLKREKELERFAVALDLETSFVNSFEEPVSEIEQAIEALKRKGERCKNELEQADQSIKELKKREETLQSELEQKEKSMVLIEKALSEKETWQPEQEEADIYEQLFQTGENDLLQQEEELGRKVKKIRKLFPRGDAKVGLDLKNNITITFFGLTFEFGKSSLKPEAYPLLVKVDKVAEMLPDSRIRITGHTDSVGDNEFNKKLSLERAKAVAGYLNEKQGIQGSRMEVSGAGESEPIVSNDTAIGRRLNRRIEITFLTP